MPSDEVRALTKLVEAAERLDDKGRNSIGLTRQMIGDARAALTQQGRSGEELEYKGEDRPFELAAREAIADCLEGNGVCMESGEAMVPNGAAEEELINDLAHDVLMAAFKHLSLPAQQEGGVEEADPDYSPAFQDEYQRLWHEAVRDRKALAENIAAELERFGSMSTAVQLRECWNRAADIARRFTAKDQPPADWPEKACLIPDCGCDLFHPYAPSPQPPTQDEGGRGVPVPLKRHHILALLGAVRPRTDDDDLGPALDLLRAGLADQPNTPLPVPEEQGEAVVTPDEAHAAILAGKTVRIVVGSDPEDPTCLHYLDRCEENDFEPMIYTEAISGWSGGVKEAVCEPDSDFYVGWVNDPPPLSISITDEDPTGRESPAPVLATSTQQEQPRCPTCVKAGYRRPIYARSKCPECNGTGRTYQPIHTPGETDMIECPFCCPDCQPEHVREEG